MIKYIYIYIYISVNTVLASEADTGILKIGGHTPPMPSYPISVNTHNTVNVENMM